MARRPARPGRTLVVFFLGLGIIYGLVALGGTWKPELGLDLQGGTRITLIAKDDPTAENLDQARAIIDQRVNGTGVAEAEVTTQGNRLIVVEIPGESRRDLVDTVKRQAQLRFRLVACSEFNPARCGGTDLGTVDQDGNPITDPEPGAGVVVPDAPAEEEPPANNRPAVGFDAKAGTTPSPSEPTESASPSEPTESASPSESASAGDEGVAPLPAPGGGPDVDDPLAWKDAPNQAAIHAYQDFTCPPDGAAANVVDNPDKPLVTCEYDAETGQSVKYLLSAAVIEGTDLDSASAGIPQNDVNWVVSLDIGGEGKDVFTEISRALVGTGEQFAIVLDGQVISAPTMEGLITNGQAQISGNFTQASAESLATSLKFGSLPIAFERDPQVETIGPTLAGDQLSAGLTAGGFGLALVLIYCLFYYRGLGLVVVASLGVAAASVYAMVLLLSTTANFTLTLPGIAGLIVAVGITADSFIVYFERIRDEMRDGKSMRVAVEAGWIRARTTCVAADAVSLLAAVVLYIFATGVVKGFAFALGLSTLIDLVVFFWFTKPMVSWLARFPFFNSGHRMSGLDAETLGVDSLPAAGRSLMGKFSRLGNSSTPASGRSTSSVAGGSGTPSRRHHRHRPERAGVQGPQLRHRVHRWRPDPGVAGLLPGDPGQRRRAARRGGRHRGGERLLPDRGHLRRLRDPGADRAADR